jgi:hypothetical protein
MAPKPVDYLLNEPEENVSRGHCTRTIGGPARILLARLAPV